MNIQKMIAVIFFAMLVAPRVKAQSFPYLSPGIRLGFAGPDGPTLTFKVSIGINSDEDFNDSEYLNLTVGVKAPLFKKRYQRQTLPFPFIQLQYGKAFFNDSSVFAGGGVGFAFLNQGSRNTVRPFLTVDAGFVAFPSIDILVASSRELLIDGGLLLVAPIPLKEI